MCLLSCLFNHNRIKQREAFSYRELCLISAYNSIYSVNTARTYTLAHFSKRQAYHSLFVYCLSVLQYFCTLIHNIYFIIQYMSIIYIIYYKFHHNVWPQIIQANVLPFLWFLSSARSEFCSHLQKEPVSSSASCVHLVCRPELQASVSLFSFFLQAISSHSLLSSLPTTSFPPSSQAQPNISYSNC